MKQVNVTWAKNYNEALVIKERLLNKYDEVEIVDDVKTDEYGNDRSDEVAIAYVV